MTVGFEIRDIYRFSGICNVPLISYFLQFLTLEAHFCKMNYLICGAVVQWENA